jgi:hypothetical protein
MKSATQFSPCFTPNQANIICNSIYLFMVLWLASFESGILHLTSTWLMTMCEVHFVVSFITMHNMWCLLWHILH